MAKTVADKSCNTDAAFFHSSSSNHVMMIGHTCVLYKINLDRSFLDAIKDGGGTLTGHSVNEEKPILRLTWKSNEGKAEDIFTKWKLDFKTVFREMKSSILLGISKAVFEPLRQDIIENIFRHFEAKLVALLDGSLVFIFWHSSEVSAIRMIENQNHVYNMFKRLLACVPETEIKFTLTPTTLREIDPSLWTYSHSEETQTCQEQSDDLQEEDTNIASVRQEIKEVRETVTQMRDVLGNLCEEVKRSKGSEGVETERVKITSEIDAIKNLQIMPDLADNYAQGVQEKALHFSGPEGVQQQIIVGRLQSQESLNPFTASTDCTLKPKEHSDEFMLSSQFDPTVKPTKGDPNVHKCSQDSEIDKQQTGNISPTRMDGASVAWPKESTSLYEKSYIEEQRRERAIKNNYDRAEMLLRNLHVSSIGQGHMDARVQRLAISVAIALEKENPPKAHGLDTVLCIDVSDSIGPDGLKEVKRAAHSFIDGVEDMAEEHALEENISVVVMGGGSQIYQQLTNDYGKVRDAIDRTTLGGRSPVFEALVICIAAIKEKGGSVVISGVHRINPRIIFLTDGFITSDRIVDGPDLATADHEGRFDVIRLIESIQREEQDISPITWVAVGKKPNMEFLRSLAKLGSGKMIESKDIQTLSKHYIIESNIGKIFCFMKNHHHGGDRNLETIESVTLALVGNMEPADKDAVVLGVLNKLDAKDIPPDPDNQPTDFDNVYEVSGILPLGTRVIRGPDWQHDDQDLNGPGTVINHSGDKGKLWVHWDLSCTNCRYSYGNGKMEVVEVEDRPRFLHQDELIEMGIRVKRGSDWSHGDQDGGRGNTGVVIRTRQDGVVKVKWQGVEDVHAYKFGMDGQFDLAICDPEDYMLKSWDNTGRPLSLEAKGENMVQSREKPNIIWQWKDDDGNWRLYSKDMRKKLEREFKRKSTGSCVIGKDRGYVRVLFQHPMHERPDGEGPRHEVQRLAVTDADLDILEATERSYHQR